MNKASEMSVTSNVTASASCRNCILRARRAILGDVETAHHLVRFGQPPEDRDGAQHFAACDAHLVGVLVERRAVTSSPSTATAYKVTCQHLVVPVVVEVGVVGVCWLV